ncbi:MAG: hypothetical protein FK730_08975 [Asgard group archaeon]|nr:hypothetical protein [Asgard group archaeon]
MVPDILYYYLQETWIFIFLISILFIFIIIFRDLNAQTRKRKSWYRRSYQKTLPRVTLTFQHFSRRGELLSVTNQIMCESIRKDMINYFKLKSGYSEDDMTSLLSDRKQLSGIFQNEQVVDFIIDINTWMKSIEPDKNIFQRFSTKIRQLFKEDYSVNDSFYIELALVIRNFRKTLDY